jgi:transposase
VPGKLARRVREEAVGKRTSTPGTSPDGRPRPFEEVETRRKFDEDFKVGAVRIVRESGKPIAQVARELGVNEGTLGNWCAQDRRARGEVSGALSEDERGELERLRKENAELTMQRDVLKRSVALWVQEAMGGR